MDKLSYQWVRGDSSLVMLHLPGHVIFIEKHSECC